MKILVLGNEGRSTLAILRSLGRAGHRLDLAWCLPGDIPAASRYVNRLHSTPAPTADEHWLPALQLLLTRERYDLVIPSSDRELIPLMLHRAALEPLARLALPSEEAFAIAFDKCRSTELAESLGLPVPRWCVLESTDLPADWTFPCVLKPLSSFDLARPSHNKHHVRTAFNRAEAESLLREMLPHGPVMAQVFFTGRGVGIELLAKDGKILAAFQHERLHEAPEGSGSTYRQSTAPHPELLKAAHLLTESMHYSGVMMVEFKKSQKAPEKTSEDKEDFIFVEINARFWGSLPLAVAAGMNFPLYLAEMMVQGRTEFPAEYTISCRARNLWKDLRWLVNNARANHGNPHLITVPRLRSLVDLVPLLLGRDHLDTYTQDDPRPAKAELRPILWRLAESLRARILPPQPNWNANRLLFLCKGNICRSPFAAMLAAKQWPQKTIRSAGTYPVSNRQSPPEAVEAARLHDLDLGPHRSSHVTPTMLEEAQQIIIFEPAQAAWIRTHYPQYASKIAYPGHGIADPFGHHLDAFKQCYQQIAQAMPRQQA